MNQVERYYNLKMQLQYTEWDIKRSEGNEVAQREYKQKAERINHELNALITEFSKEENRGGNKKFDLLTALSHVISSIELIRSKNSYPDLNQGMIIPGYLFGMIVSDLNLTLKLDGGIPMNAIYMSAEIWPCDQFLTLLNDIKSQLSDTQFTSFMQLLEFYESSVREPILNFFDDMKESRIN